MVLLAIVITICDLAVPSADGRPPQFVVVSFDGAGDAEEVRFWIDAGERLKARFTFFLSGVYLLAGDQALRYAPPRHPLGSSEIGFAIKPDDADSRAGIAALVAALNDADAGGHEIATHFNGHFCGRLPGAVGSWSPDDWRRELDQFDALVRNVGENNQLETRLQLRHVVGARTPCLEGNLAWIRQVLAERGFAYDASVGGFSGRWPWRDQVWCFPIPLVLVAGETFATLATDYNFYLNQTGASDADAALTATLAEQTYRSFRAYFDERYGSERAPISIAYHFEDWNHGAYRDALIRLLSEICDKHDVRCVTYRDVVEYLER
jgi:hypothetical protein